MALPTNNPTPGTSGVLTTDITKFVIKNGGGATNTMFFTTLVNPTTNVIDVRNMYLIDSNGKISIDWGQHGLVDVLQVVSIDYGNRVLYDATGNARFDYGAQIFESDSSQTVGGWNNSSLYVALNHYFCGNGTLLSNLFNLGNPIGIGSVVTNNGLVWFSTNLAANTSPNVPAPNGSILTATNGAFYVRSNNAWVLH